jgi:hypothetical protein
LKEFPVKKIALSVVIASTFALAACGGNTAANNSAAVNDTMQNANDLMNQAQDMQNQGAAVSNELNAVAANGVAAVLDAANSAMSDVSNATNSAAAH